MALAIENGANRQLDICGEIGTLLPVGKKEFFLCCKYCEYICAQLEDFIQHINDDHFWKFESAYNITPPKTETELEMEVMKPSELSEDTCKEGVDSVVQYFEKVAVDETNQMNDETFEEEAIEIEDVKFELSPLQSSDEADNDTEISPTEQINLWNEEFDLPEHKEKANFLRREVKKKFILEFIEVYRSLPALWNLKSKVYFNRQKKGEQYEILVQKFKEEYPCATRQDVVKQINSLRTCYKKELSRIGTSGISTLYYFDAMHFLRNIIALSESRNKLKMTQATSKQTRKKFTPPVSLLNNEELINLAQIYKGYPCLWDENDIAYRFANRRREALTNICDEINKTMKLKLTCGDLEKEILLLRKLCSIEKKEKIACQRNNEIYKPSCPYSDHIAYLECDVPPYQCSICDKIVAGPQQHKIHEASHDGSLPFKCQICGHGFKETTNLAVHLRRHVQDFTYKCEVCDKPCATTTELKTHMRSHTRERAYVCDLCGKSYPTKATFSTHMDRHEQNPKFKCEICSKPFYERKKVREHMTVHTQSRDKICNVCNKGFANVKHLRQHQLIHNPKKKYECKICGKRFAQGAGLNCHMKSHGTKFTTNDPGSFIFE